MRSSWYPRSPTTIIPSATPDGHDGEVDEVGAGDEEHRERGQRDDHRRAEVRLLEHERGDRREDEQERDRPRPEPTDPGATLGEPVGEVDDQRELGELGRVDRRQRTAA